MKWYVFKLFLVLACLGVSGCLRIGSSDGSSSRNGSGAPGGGPEFSSNGPRGNGEGFLGAIASVRNAQARCGFQPDTDHPGQVEVICRVAIRDLEGSEKEATGIEEGTTLTWASPQRLKGPELQSLSCRVVDGNLTQICDVILGVSETGLGETTQLEFSLQASSATVTPPPSKTTVSLISAQSYGVVPHLPTFQALTSSRNTPDGKSVGLQLNDFDPLNTVFGDVTSICVQNQRVFFSTATNVFVVENGRARLYAGSSNRSNRANLTSRLTVSLAPEGNSPPRIGCLADSIVVSQSMPAGKSRMVRLRDDGPAEIFSGPGPAPFPYSFVEAGPNGHIILVPQSKSGNFYQLLDFSPETREVRKLATGLTVVPSNFALQFPYAYFQTGGKIFRTDLRTGDTLHWAATGVIGFSGDGGPATEAQFFYPGAMLADPSQNLYIADTNNRRVRKVSPTGIVTTVFGGTIGTHEQCGQGTWTPSWGNSCSFSALAMDAGGTLYIGTAGFRIWKLLASGEIGELVSSKGYQLQTGTQDLKTASFQSVNAVAIAGDMIYATEYDGNVRRLKVKEGTVDYVPIRYQDRMSEIRALPNGDMLLTRIYRAMILKPNGQLIEFLGGAGKPGASAEDGTLATNFAVVGIHGVFHPDGTFYFVSRDLAGIFAVDPSTQKVRRIAGTGTQGYSGDGGPALSAQINSDGTIDIGKDSALYFSDSFNSRIRRIDLATNIITTIAGSGPKGVYKEGGWADEVPFNRPTSVRVTSQGDIYVADPGSYAVRVLHPVPRENGSVRYAVTTLLGDAKPNNECSGRISHRVQSGAGEQASEVKASLDNFCQSTPMALDVSDTCQQPDGEVRVAVSQSFSPTGAHVYASSIAMITRPCN